MFCFATLFKILSVSFFGDKLSFSATSTLENETPLLVSSYRTRSSFLGVFVIGYSVSSKSQF
jgi:hypothetical protein